MILFLFHNKLDNLIILVFSFLKYYFFSHSYIVYSIFNLFNCTSIVSNLGTNRHQILGCSLQLQENHWCIQDCSDLLEATKLPMPPAEHRERRNPSETCTFPALRNTLYRSKQASIRAAALQCSIQDSDQPRKSSHGIPPSNLFPLAQEACDNQGMFKSARFEFSFEWHNRLAIIIMIKWLRGLKHAHPPTNPQLQDTQWFLFLPP